MPFGKDANVQRKMLSKCTSLLQVDPRIEGAYVVGSMADETEDEYSDIDLYVVVKEEHYAEVYGERFKFAKRIGEVLSTFEVEWPNCQMLGVIYRNYVEIDICYTKLGQAEVFSDRYKVVLDRSGRVQKTLITREYPKDPKTELKRQIEFALYNLLHAVNMLHRGEYWSSIKQIETLRKRTVSLVEVLLKKEVGEEYRKLESVFPPKAERKLRRTLCLYRKSDIRKSVKISTQLFCEIGGELAFKLGVIFPSEKFSHLLQHLEK